MDKSMANGGPPSYTPAYDSASASASTSTPATAPAPAAQPVPEDVATPIARQSSRASQNAAASAAPAWSIFALTQAALELPHITTTRRILPPPPQPSPLPAFLLHCTLFASYDLHAPHPVPFRDVGCPATHARGEAGATAKSKVSQSVTRLRKRLGVQIPLAYLGSPGFNPCQLDAVSPRGGLAFLSHPQPRNGAEMTARSGNVGRYRKVSLFQAQAREMTHIVSRPLVERVVSAVYAGQGIYNRMAVFPAEAVLSYTRDAEQADEKQGWLAKLKAKAKSSDSKPDSAAQGAQTIAQVRSPDTARGNEAIKSVKAPMVFATLDLLAPPPRLLETGGPYPVEMNKASDSDLATSARLISEFDRGSDDERFSRFLFTPTEADDALFAQMLRALERRGAIWCEAGRLITPSSRNPNPRERARFLVKGVFPERFANRCRFYRARKFEPMPSDLSPHEVRKFGAPLIVHTVVERTGSEGIDINDYVQPQPTNAHTATRADDDDMFDWEWDENDLAPRSGEGGLPDYTSAQKEQLKGYGIQSARARALVEAEADFFTGWSIGVTDEPFKNGGWMESMGTGSALWFAGGAF
ncbi:hypothetical protein PANT_6d00095 [Moesziomyces antarcticus T-34]|uniref:Uncharacterized protein n=1 Tax=Pseudozyma antarctica (strain T-34) TaxID=1151754 RepID=M9LL00_PSEA3|nr:hypothetical protein PANT_6d00095 [Moesziomyces antarcticus T-34]